MPQTFGEQTIGNWTLSTLTRVITDIFTRNPPRNFPVLDVDELTIHEALLVEKKVTFTGQDFKAVGNTGNPAFQNSWTNWGAPYGAASFVKSPDGWVRVHGVVKNLTNPLTLPSTIFTLPPGYRPEASCIFLTLDNNALGRIEIDSSGNVQMVAPSSTAAPYATLDSITFKSTTA